MKRIETDKKEDIKMLDRQKFSEEEILNDFKENIELKILEEQLEYYWIRLYTNEEYDLKPGTIIEMSHLPTGEKLDLMFTNYDKVGKTGTQAEELEEYEAEEDKKVLCLLVNITELHKADDADYVRTLFRKSRFYEERLLKRKDLVFSTQHKNFMEDLEEKPDNKLKEGIVIEYYDAMF
jgi:hypothetical protein